MSAFGEIEQGEELSESEEDEEEWAVVQDERM